MYSLWLQQGSNVVGLNGPLVTAPGWAAVLLPAFSDGEQLTQEIHVSLEGSPAAIEARLSELMGLMEAAAAQAELPGGAFVYLQGILAEGGPIWRSKILRGVVSLLGGGIEQRLEGSQGVCLTLDRLNYWEGERTALALSNANGAHSTAPILVYNHEDFDPGAVNWVKVMEEDTAGGELPAPIELQFRGLALNGNGTLITGGFAKKAAGNHVMFEGEGSGVLSGATGTVTYAVGASNDAMLRVTWATADDVDVWVSQVLSSDYYGEMRGGAYLPVVRLHNTIATDRLYLYWRLLVNNAGILDPVHDSPGVFAPNLRFMCPCAPVFLPPWPLADTDDPPGLVLQLRAQGEALAHTLDIDRIDFVSLESWRIYRPVVQLAGVGLQVLDDPYEDRLRSLDDAIQYHTAEGPGLWVLPGREHTFTFVWERANGGWSVQVSAYVQMFYRPRKRVL